MRIRITMILVLLFVASPVQSQWLPDSEQKYYRQMWEKSGVEFPEGGKFYRLPRVSQRIVTVNSTRAHGIYDANYRESGEPNINQQFPWVTPAGLHWSPKDQWTKIALAYFPPGREIPVWTEWTTVKNSFGSYQPETRMSWRFPKGTLFGEMLIRRHPDGDFPFEIREREKITETRWGGGTTYRPEIPVGVQAWGYTIPPGKLTDFGVGSKRTWLYRMPAETRTGPVKLVASKYAMTTEHSGGVVPQNYMGNTMKCAECHARTGTSTSYGATNVPGSDQVISWHPFTTATLNSDRHPQVDTQTWPVREYRGMFDGR